MNRKVERVGRFSFWWGEATDEPAREDARPTDRFMAPMRVRSWRLRLSMNRQGRERLRRALIFRGRLPKKRSGLDGVSSYRGKLVHGTDARPILEVEALNEPTCSAGVPGVPPASSPSVSLDEGPGGETPPELPAMDNCAAPCRFTVPVRGNKTVEATDDSAQPSADAHIGAASLRCINSRMWASALPRRTLQVP
jgi:hypothetical protein